MLDLAAPSTKDPYAHLRVPGQIQAFGALLTAHPQTLRVLNASDNVQAMLGVAHADLLGRALPELVDNADAFAEVRDSLAAEEVAFVNPLLFVVGGRRFDAVLHLHDGLLFVELAPLADGAPIREDMDRLSDEAIQGMIMPETLETLLEAAPQVIRAVTSFDRVLLYRFDEQYHGQVIGEARKAGVESFAGLFFPESDIPEAARQLYQENFCRYIPLITAPGVRMLPPDNPLTGRPLDLSRAMLRGVLPCHMEYLSNMGVAASMSFSIVSDQRLWGLFACHHYGPSALSYTQRLVCEQVAMMFVAKLEQFVNPEAVEEALQAVRAQVLAGTPLLHADPLAAPWSQADETALLALVNAEGAAIYREGVVGAIGACPDLTDLYGFIGTKPDEFRRLLHRFDNDGLFYSNNVASTLPGADKLRERGSGIMVVPLARGRAEYLLWFRPEQVVKATWAGNPAETVVKNPDGQYSPRHSFAAWKQDIHDRAAAWTPGEIRNALALRDALLARAA